MLKTLDKIYEAHYIIYDSLGQSGLQKKYIFLEGEKEIMKKNNKKGFTLAELLIVVAIIAVLVAIAIPIFTAQLEKSRDATTVANIRSAYAEASALMLSEPSSTSASSGNATKTAANVVAVTPVNVESSDNTYWEGNSPFNFSLTGLGAKNAGGYTATFTFATDGTVSCVLTAN